MQCLLDKKYFLPHLFTGIFLLAANYSQARDLNHRAKKILTNQALVQQILNDNDMKEALFRARQLLKTGFNAGSGYNEVWIRDLNTFIELSCEVNRPETIKDTLTNFFEFQGENGNVPDGYRGRETHKNTIETDQETSLVQACFKYIHKTGDTSFLEFIVKDKSILKRMELALEFLLNERFSQQYGLLWGGTTADWGDVQPEDSPGVNLNQASHKAIDVYDNAMFLIAINNFVVLNKGDKAATTRWSAIGGKVRKNIRKHLWDSCASKFIPHIYLNGSPFPKDFNESGIYYHGGTAVAIEAGLLSRKEIAACLVKMIDNVNQSGAPSIGLTIYPPYPQGFFKNPQMKDPYSYQNGGDWTWFGGRMIQVLIENGYAEDAYHLIRPMISRILKNDGFFEWYNLNNEPKGSGKFRGSAGVLGKAVEMLVSWAKANDSGNKRQF